MTSLAPNQDRVDRRCASGLVLACAGLLLLVPLGSTLAGDEPALEAVGEPAAVTREARVLRDPADDLAQQVFALARAGKFDDLAPHLATLRMKHPTNDARYVASLFAIEKAYAAARREQALVWLADLEKDTPPRFAPAVADAGVWCRIDAADLETPSVRLLELVEKHARSSLAVAALECRAKVLAEHKRPDEAIFVYHALLACFPTAPCAADCTMAVARLHHAQGQNREAAQWLARLAKDYPAAHTDAALYLGIFVHAGEEEPARSQECLEKLVADHPASRYWPDAACRLAELHLSAREFEAAEAVARRIGENTAAEDALKQRALFVLLQSAIAQQQWKNVEQQAEALLAAEPPEAQRLLARFWEAEAAYRSGNREQACERFLDLSLMVVEKSDDWLAIVPLRLAQIDAQRQHWSLALERIDLLIKQHPTYARRYEAEYLQGRCLLAQAKFQEARAAFARAIASPVGEQTETAAMAQWMIGETYFLQKRYDEAIAAYDLAIASDFPAWQAAALLQSAKCYEQLARFHDATGRYERLVRDYPETSFVAEARSRLNSTRERSTVATQNPPSTATR